MDDGELDFSSHDIFPNPDMDNQIPSSGSMESFFEDIFRDTHACTHTHTCNPPGPDFSHTHTCFHVHTKIVPATTDDKTTTDDTAESVEKSSKKRPQGNREAVKKYREKKKARAASLEDEVVKLRALNQHLMKRLQSQSVLEAEIARLKCLLVDIRGRIEGEIGSFPYQKTVKSAEGVSNMVQPDLAGSFALDSCNVSCGDQVYCLRPDGEDGALNGQGFRSCQTQIFQCPQNQTLVMKEFPGCGSENVVNRGSSSSLNKRKGARASTNG